MMCVIVPVIYLAPKSFAILSTEREEYVGEKKKKKKIG